MSAPPSSSFVTATAWSFIAASACTTAIALVQCLVLWALFDPVALAEAMALAFPQGLPPVMAATIRRMPAIAATLLALSALSLWASIGLLLRQAWARLAMIALLVLGIVANLLGLALQFVLLDELRVMMVEVMPGAPELDDVLVGSTVTGAITALVFSGLFGWLVVRLCAPEVVAEFRERARSP